MIRLIKQGDYRIIKDRQRILLEADGLGPIPILTWPNLTLCPLTGKYRLYETQGENGLSDSLHLEINLGRGMWQGFLLFNKQAHSTTEIITHSVKFLF